jgi:glucose-1-phosphatase
MLRTVLFDLGNVLVHFCHVRMCQQMGGILGCSGDEARNWLIDSGLMWEFERGRLTDAELQRALEKKTGRPVALELLTEACSDIFSLNEPIVPVIESLKSRGLRLVVLSNTSRWHVEWIRRHWTVLDLFDELVLSYEVGAIKPEDAIFEAAVRAIQCKPAECFYTDDIPRYVERGRKFGLQAEVFTNVPSLVKHLAERGIGL